MLCLFPGYNLIVRLDTCWLPISLQSCDSWQRTDQSDQRIRISDQLELGVYYFITRSVLSLPGAWGERERERDLYLVTIFNMVSLIMNLWHLIIFLQSFSSDFRNIVRPYEVIHWKPTSRQG